MSGCHCGVRDDAPTPPSACGNCHAPGGAGRARVCEVCENCAGCSEAKGFGFYVCGRCGLCCCWVDGAYGDKCAELGAEIEIVCERCRLCRDCAARPSVEPNMVCALCLACCGAGVCLVCGRCRDCRGRPEGDVDYEARGVCGACSEVLAHPHAAWAACSACAAFCGDSVCPVCDRCRDCRGRPEGDGEFCALNGMCRACDRLHCAPAGEPAGAPAGAPAGEAPAGTGEAAAAAAAPAE